MRKNAERVLQAFADGKPAVGDSRRTVHTDGRVVYSYRMPIAARLTDGTVIVVRYADAPTATTKSHVRACERSFPAAERGTSDEVKRAA